MPKCYLVNEESYRSKNLCRQLVQIAKKKNLTQQVLADELGYSQPRVSQKISNGDLNLIDFIKVIKLLKMNVVFDAEGKIVVYERDKKDGVNHSNCVVINPYSGDILNH